MSYASHITHDGLRNKDDERTPLAQPFARIAATQSAPIAGIRHAWLTELAKGGASEAEIRATSGHKIASMVARYTKKSDQKRIAEAAQAWLQPAVVRLRNANGV